MKKYKGAIILIIIYITVANLVALPITIMADIQWYVSCFIATVVAISLIAVDIFIKALTKVFDVIAKSK